MPDGGGGPGLDTVDMYNNSKVKLEGDFVVGDDTDLFSRAGGGQINTNTLDLNGHSDTVEFLGTHLGATFVIDFGVTPGANSFLWETTHHHVGTYNFVNFEIGVDTLTLGNAGSTWWTVLDTETDGGGSPDTEVDKSHMTINGIPYHAFDAGVTTPYWSLVNPEDPSASRNVQFFNLRQRRFQRRRQGRRRRLRRLAQDRWLAVRLRCVAVELRHRNRCRTARRYRQAPRRFLSPFPLCS